MTKKWYETMTERDICLKLEQYAKDRYGKNLYWHNIKDLPTKRQHKKPFDVIGSFYGRSFAIEFKMPTGVLQERQYDELKEHACSGGCSDVIYLLQDMQINKQILDSFFECMSKDFDDFKMVFNEKVYKK